MITVILVDDERPALRELEYMLKEYPEIAIRGMYTDPFAALEEIPKIKPQVVFLDINMVRMKGIDLAARILEMLPKTKIIFITAHENYAVRAFEIEALDYLIKPITQERLNNTVQRITSKSEIDKEVKPFIQCFESFNLYVKGEIVTWHHSKAKEILALLIHKQGTPVDWQVIVDAVWPDYDCEKGHANFHANMYLLRKFLRNHGLEKIVENKRGHYRILTQKVECDVYEFQRIIAETPYAKPDKNKLNKALALYKGEYMGDNDYLWAFSKAAALSKDYQKFVKFSAESQPG